MAIQMSRTDADTMATYEEGYGRIDKASGTLEEDRLVATLNWYCNADAAGNGAKPVTKPDIIVLEGDEVTQFKSDAMTSLYRIIMARQDYSEAQAV